MKNNKNVPDLIKESKTGTCIKLNEQENSRLKLTTDEIDRIGDFVNLTDKEKDQLSTFIFNFSIVLYKSCNDDRT